MNKHCLEPTQEIMAKDDSDDIAKMSLVAEDRGEERGEAKGKAGAAATPSTPDMAEFMNMLASLASKSKPAGRLEVRNSDVRALAITFEGSLESNRENLAEVLEWNGMDSKRVLPIDVRKGLTFTDADANAAAEGRDRQFLDEVGVGGTSRAHACIVRACVHAGLVRGPAEHRAITRGALETACGKEHKDKEAWAVGVARGLHQALTARAGVLTEAEVATMVSAVAKATNAPRASLMGLTVGGRPWTTITLDGGKRVPLDLCDKLVLRRELLGFIQDCEPFYQSPDCQPVTEGTSAAAWRTDATSRLCWWHNYRGGCQHGSSCQFVDSHIGAAKVVPCPHNWDGKGTCEGGHPDCPCSHKFARAKSADKGQDKQVRPDTTKPTAHVHLACDAADTMCTLSSHGRRSEPSGGKAVDPMDGTHWLVDIGSPVGAIGPTHLRRWEAHLKRMDRKRINLTIHFGGDAAHSETSVQVPVLIGGRRCWVWVAVIDRDMPALLPVHVLEAVEGELKWEGGEAVVRAGGGTTKLSRAESGHLLLPCRPPRAWAAWEAATAPPVHVPLLAAEMRGSAPEADAWATLVSAGGVVKPLSGVTHSDLAHPEVAQALRSAVATEVWRARVTLGGEAVELKDVTPDMMRDQRVRDAVCARLHAHSGQAGHAQGTGGVRAGGGRVGR